MSATYFVYFWLGHHDWTGWSFYPSLYLLEEYIILFFFLLFSNLLETFIHG